MIGFGTTLGSATGLSPALFAGILFAVVLVFLRRDTINATVASALLIGAVNITLIVAISILALAHLDTANLVVPAGLGLSDLSAAGGLIFGVVLVSYFGHTSAGNAAKVVLQRDPSGRALLRGNILAMVTVIGLYCLAVLAIGGAVPADQLIGYEGTALTPWPGWWARRSTSSGRSMSSSPWGSERSRSRWGSRTRWTNGSPVVTIRPAVGSVERSPVRTDGSSPAPCRSSSSSRSSSGCSWPVSVRSPTRSGSSAPSPSRYWPASSRS